MPTETLTELAPKVYANPGVKMDNKRTAFLVAVRLFLPDNFAAIIVTSGTRTYSEQAAAMWTKYSNYGAKELYDTYADDKAITELIALPRDQWPSKIEDLANHGRYLSRHLRADAMDLRTRDYTEAERAQLIDAVKKAGGRPLYESQPPHLHVDHIPDQPGIPDRPLSYAEGDSLSKLGVVFGAALVIGGGVALAKKEGVL